MLDVAVQNIILGISLAAAIGPVSIEIIKRGFKYGFNSAFLATLGVILADTIYLFLIYFGLSELFKIIAIKLMLSVVGSIVLIYLGFLSVKDFKSKIRIDSKIKNNNSFIAGFMITISNPMTIVAWISVFSSVTGALIKNSPFSTAIFYILAIVLGVFIWFSFLSMLLHFGKRFVNEKMLRYITLIAGIVLILFGINFAYGAIFLFI